MPAKARSDQALERAYVESKVIKTGLDRIATHLDVVDDHLRDDLHKCTQRFDSYMRDLHEACARAGLSPVRR